MVSEFRYYASIPAAVHALVIDPRTCGLVFHTAKGQGRRVGRETTSSIASRYQAAGLDVVAAINADFFSFDPPGVSEGPQISGGVLLKSEGSHREALEDRLLRLQPVFAISHAGKPIITHTRLQGAVRAGTRTAGLAGVNVRPRSDSAFVYTPFWGDSTPTDSTALEFVVRNGRVASLDAEPGGIAIPGDGAVISVKGAARDRFAQVAAGDSMTWTAGFAGLDRPIELVGGYPMLLVDGAPVHHQEAGLRPPFSDRRHPRAAIGIDRTGRIHVVAVDGRQPGYSEGMTLEEFSAFLLAHGITDALNFDGGGSTTLVVRGRIVNRPSDSSGERAVANALLILDRSQASSCARTR